MRLKIPARNYDLARHSHSQVKGQWQVRVIGGEREVCSLSRRRLMGR